MDIMCMCVRLPTPCARPKVYLKTHEYTAVSPNERDCSAGVAFLFVYTRCPRDADANNNGTSAVVNRYKYDHGRGTPSMGISLWRIASGRTYTLMRVRRRRHCRLICTNKDASGTRTRTIIIRPVFTLTNPQ